MMIKSFHFIPANNDHFLEKCPQLQADAFILDLEDAVSNENKEKARQNVKQLASDIPNCYVRINARETEHFEKDVELLQTISEQISGIVIPKIGKPDTITLLREALQQSVSLLPLFEQFCDLKQADAILKAPEITYAGLGLEDMFQHIPYENESLLELRKNVQSEFVLSCYANNTFPIDVIATERSNFNTYRDECHKARSMGFVGKFSIHPDQIDHINSIFKASKAEVRWAKMILAHAQEKDSGYTMHDDGVLTTPPKIKKALNILNHE